MLGPQIMEQFSSKADLIEYLRTHRQVSTILLTT